MNQMPHVTVHELDDDAVLLDVREHDEFDAGHAPRAVHIPLGELPQRLGEVPDVEQLDVVCRGGGRSARAVVFLLQQGKDVRNVDGGMSAWAAAGKSLTAEHDGQPVIL